MCGLAAIFVLAAVDFLWDGQTAATIVFGVLGLLCASFPALVLLGRLRRGRVSLSAAGIRQRGWTFESFLPWEAFAGVRAAANGRPEVLVIAYANASWERRQVVRSWKIDQLPPVPMVEFGCAVFDIAPELLYWLLKFYVEHPEARVELGTEAVAGRIRAGALAVTDR
jgi:Bacterial PH domain